MLSYQEPATSLTLEAGLADYYASHPGLELDRGASEAARAFFRDHDVAHVVFACSTSLVDEAAVKIWSFFGTTGGFGLLSGYRLPESQAIYEEIPRSAVLPTALRCVTVVPKVWSRCRRMHARWPWTEHAAYHDVPLVDIRREFGIEVLTA